jgi:uncharacterized protein
MEFQIRDYPTEQPTPSSIWTGMRWYDVLDPPYPDIIEIASALSKQCRYNGLVPWFYSVAEHSIMVSQYIADVHGPDLALAGLLHDAAEAYIGDIVRPLKGVIHEAYDPIEAAIMATITEEYILPDDSEEIVHEADMAVYEWEVSHLRFGDNWNEVLPRHAEHLFLNTFDSLVS